MLLIFWDFDGTIANSEKKFYLTLKQFIQDKIPNIISNIDEFTEEFYYKNCAGKKYYEDFKILGDKGIIDYSKITEKDLNNFLDYLSIELQNVKDGEITFTKGMDNLLMKLSKEKNIKMVIDTNARKSDFILKSKALKNNIIDEIIKNNNGYSSTDLSQDYKYLNFEKYKIMAKPNPAIFIFAIEDVLKQNIKIENIIIIEDSPSAVKGGKNFIECEYAKNKFKNIKVIGYTAGDHKPDGQALLENGADVIIDNANDLYNYIKKFEK